jgi:Icc protein
MKLAWATDIHFDSCPAAPRARFLADLAASGAEVVLIGGDIAEAPDLEEWLRPLEEALRRPIFFVLGNHDYYGGSVEPLEARMRALEAEWLRYLPGAGVVPLTPATGLVGHGGWGDARCGRFLDSSVVLSDYVLILDLQQASGSPDPLAILEDRPALQRKLHELGDRAAEELRPQLAEAVRRFAWVLVLTHVPPFREACWHGGKISDEEWLPGFVCKAMGDVLLTAAAEHPECEITVLCGHTHGEGEARLLPNLMAYTQGARYGAPAFRMLEVE